MQLKILLIINLDLALQIKRILQSLLSVYDFLVQLCEAFTVAFSSILAFDFLVLISFEFSLEKSARVLWMPLQMPSFSIIFSQGLACFFPLIIPWLFILRVIDILFIWAAIAEFFQSVPGFVLPLHIWAPEFHKSSFALVLVFRVLYKYNIFFFLSLHSNAVAVVWTTYRRLELKVLGCKTCEVPRLPRCVAFFFLLYRHLLIAWSIQKSLTVKENLWLGELGKIRNMGKCKAGARHVRNVQHRRCSLEGLFYLLQVPCYGNGYLLIISWILLIFWAVSLDILQQLFQIEALLFVQVTAWVSLFDLLALIFRLEPALKTRTDPNLVDCENSFSINCSKILLLSLRLYFGFLSFLSSYPRVDFFLLDNTFS